MTFQHLKERIPLRNERCYQKTPPFSVKRAEIHLHSRRSLGILGSESGGGDEDDEDDCDGGS